MRVTTSNILEQTVATLLNLGDMVWEVSEEHMITRIWKNEHAAESIRINAKEGKKIADIGDDTFTSLCKPLICETFRTRQKVSFDFNTVDNEALVSYNLRILPIHPDSTHLLVVIERLPKPKGSNTSDSELYMALDAAGDGMWDINLETSQMHFSEKWYKKFGYTPEEISSVADWTSRVHPDDLEQSKKKIEEYLTGKVPFYSTELRYKAKNGEYRWLQGKGVFGSRAADGRPLRFIGTHTDINEKKKADEAYKSTSELLSKLINNLQRGILVTSNEGEIIYANQMFCDIYQISGSPDQLAGQQAADGLQHRKLIFKESEEFFRKTTDILQKGEEVRNEEWELKDGKIFKRDFIPISIDNTHKGGIWILVDITEEKLAERKIETQRRFYENVLHSIPADIAVFDSAHRYLFVNKHAFKNEELRQWMIGKTDIDYCNYRNKPLSFAEGRYAFYESAEKSGGKVQKIEKLTDADGNDSYHLRLLHPVFYENGQMEFLMAYGLNITDLIKAQEAQKTSMETFASAFDHSGIGMALISPEGKWLDVNNEFCHMTGYSKEELQNLTFQDITYPEDLEIDLGLLRQMVKKQINTYNLEKRYISKTKKIVWASLTVSLVWNSDDTPKFFVAQVVDITRKKQLADEITRKNADLEAIRGSLVNKISQLEELSNIIAHNLRGPVSNIKMFAEELTLGDNKSSTGMNEAFTHDEMLGIIKDSSTSLMETLKVLMEITQIKLNKNLANDECDLNGIIRDIMNQLHGTIYENHASIELSLEIKHITYPKVYLESILYNLISNAIKYSNPTEPPIIIISSKKVNNRIVLSVKDNGLGIDMSKYGNKIFKLNQVFHTGYDSKGIGLFLTKTQIESLGGTIEVKSKPNEGSEFIVTI